MGLTKLLESLQTVSLGSLTLHSVLYTLFLLVIAYILIRLISRQLRRALEKSRMEKGFKNLITNVARVGLWILALVIIAERLNVPTASIVTALGVVGLALSLSLQDMLTNIFSGMTILATRPFASGDYVSIGETGGNVQEVGIFHTILLTSDQKRIHVPNRDVAAGRIINFSSQTNRRIELPLRLPLDSSPDTVRQALLLAVSREEKILPDPAPAVVLTGYQNGAADFSLRAWVPSGDYWEVFFRLNETAPEELRKAGISLAGNRVDVQIENPRES